MYVQYVCTFCNKFLSRFREQESTDLIDSKHSILIDGVRCLDWFLTKAVLSPTGFIYILCNFGNINRILALGFDLLRTSHLWEEEPKKLIFYKLRKFNHCVCNKLNLLDALNEMCYISV